MYPYITPTSPWMMGIWYLDMHRVTKGLLLYPTTWTKACWRLLARRCAVASAQTPRLKKTAYVRIHQHMTIVSLTNNCHTCPRISLMVAFFVIFFSSVEAIRSVRLTTESELCSSNYEDVWSVSNHRGYNEQKYKIHTYARTHIQYIHCVMTLNFAEDLLAFSSSVSCKYTNRRK